MFHFKVNVVFLLSVLLSYESLSAPEPLCSKFSYDELLLEKMVRMEFNVNVIEKNILKTEKTIQETQENMRETQESMVKKIDDKIKELEQKEAEFIDNINNAVTDRESRNNLVVAFHAHVAADKSLVNNQVIVFTRVTMNEGDGYDNSNGYFTAPVNGIYHFMIHLCGQTGMAINYVVIANEKTIASGLFTSRSTGQCTSFSVATLMHSKERAWVTIDASGSSSDILFEDSDDWNYFSGFLVHETA